MIGLLESGCCADTIAGLMRGFGLEVEIAASPVDTLAMAHRLRPQGVLIALDIPGLREIDELTTFVSNLRKAGVTMVLGMSTTLDELSAISFGLDGFIPKGQIVDRIGEIVELMCG